MMIGGGPAGQERPARLLLVDDDPNLLVVLAEQLRDDGYDVATARDGVEALRRLESGWPDLAIIDMMMPRLDGLSLAREIKARADLPIIVLSAIDAADSKAELLDEVAEDYVTKPYHYPELRARVNRVLRRLGDRLPGAERGAGTGTRPRAPSALGDRERGGGRPDADRIAAPLRPRRQPRPDDLHGDAPPARLGRHRGRRPVLRLGLDAAPADEAGGRSEPAPPPRHGARRRLPPGGRARRERQRAAGPDHGRGDGRCRPAGRRLRPPRSSSAGAPAPSPSS